jgi:hypothetical protein
MIDDVVEIETEFQEQRHSQTGVWEREMELEAAASKPPGPCALLEQAT